MPVMVYEAFDELKNYSKLKNQMMKKSKLRTSTIKQKNLIRLLVLV